jgi:hypothetical protein
MRQVIRLSKIILIDTLGVICIIGAILLGWLPGPGGIPLLLAGLGLLAINHPWAQRRMDWLKDRVKKLLKKH